MAVSESEATFTPMESPDWLQNIPGDYFSQFQSQGPQSYYDTWNDIRSRGNEYLTMLNQLSPVMAEATKGAAGGAQYTYDEMLNRMMSGQPMVPEYSANSQYMKNFTDMVATPDDYSSFLPDQDFYAGYLDDLMANSIELGYGDQSISFLPGSTAESIAKILESMADAGAQTSKSYSGEKSYEAQAYPTVLGDLLGAEQNTLQNIIPSYADKQFQYEMEPYNALFTYGLLPYQESYNLATQYPQGSDWQAYMADYYNMWSPFELARFYQQPSYSMDSGTSAMDYISSILGLAGGAYNLFGGSSGISDIWDSLFGGSSSNGVSDYISTSDFMPSSYDTSSYGWYEPMTSDFSLDPAFYEW